MIPQVGDRYTWTPAAFIRPDGREGYELARSVTGRIVHVSAAHRHFTAEAVLNGYTLRETFKFSS